MPRSYDEPPVLEALAEVYFADGDWDLATPGLFYEQVRDRFPHRQEVGEVSVTLNLAAAAKPIVQQNPQRIQFLTEDRSRLVQIARHLLVVNQLRPYPHFPEWSAVFAEMLEIYGRLSSPSSFQRVGVRYINQIIYPEPVFELSRLFAIYPEVPTQVGSPFGPFLLRVETRPPLHADHVLLTTFSSAKTEGGEQALLLDYYDTFTPDTPGHLDQIQQLIVDAHENIESAFEHSITDEARAMFKEVRHAGTH